jgi:fructose-1,6-bisphosphatase/inositol monophosphatase family enzyme
MNFVHSFPHVSISIALLVNKTPEIAVITNPVLGQFFEARKGQGALMNGKPIKVSGIQGKNKNNVLNWVSSTLIFIFRAFKGAVEL